MTTRARPPRPMPNAPGPNPSAPHAQPSDAGADEPENRPPRPEDVMLTREEILAAVLVIEAVPLQRGATLRVRALTCLEFEALVERMQSRVSEEVRAEVIAASIVEADRSAFLAALVAGLAEPDLDRLVTAACRLQGGFVGRWAARGWNP